MKIYVYLICIIFTSKSSAMSPRKSNPGCIRQNSDEWRRDLLFMHLANGQISLVVSLLDHESMCFNNVSGQSIFQALTDLKKKQKAVDINPILKRLEDLNKQILIPTADLPD